MSAEIPELKPVRPRDFQRDQEGVGDAEKAEALIRVLDLQERQPGVLRLRDWALAAVAPRPGEVAVDIGAGTGTEVRRLATAVGSSGRAVGIEPHTLLRTEARRRAADVGSGAEFIDGEAMALPFADGSVDVVRSERVFQHLTDPEAAALEVARVLRPGGRCVLLDTDWATSITHPGDPDVLRRYDQAFTAAIANPFAGRLLGSWLARAGLEVDPDIGSAALVMPLELLTGPVLIRHNAENAVAAGLITRAEADDLIAGVIAAAGKGEAFSSVTMFGAVGRRSLLT